MPKKEGAPVKIRRFDVTESLRFTRSNDHHIRWNEVITLQPNHVSHLDIFPLLFPE